MKSSRIGFLGAGNMAGALVSGLLASGSVDKTQVRISDSSPQRLAELGARHDIQTHGSNAELIAWANVVVLSVKPQVVPAVLAECGAHVGAGHLLGLHRGRRSPRHARGKARPRRARHPRHAEHPRARPSRRHAISAGSLASSADLDVARALFDAVGKTVVLPESHLDAVTGLSGSGPGYVMLFIEALADGGVKSGLPRDVALLLATQTVLGSAKLLQETGDHPARLKDMVTSPGGTTIAGLTALETAGVRGAILTAVEKATQRATELGKKT